MGEKTLTSSADSNLKETSIFKLAFPLFIQMLLSMCLGYVDTAMLSHCSQTAVGAVGNANQIMEFLMLAFTIISSAAGVVVAQYLGARQIEKMNQIYTVSIVFNLVLSVFVCFSVVAFCPSLLKLINVPDEMIEDSVAYIRIVGYVLFCNAVVQVFFQIFNCHGKTGIGTAVVFGMNIFNLIGNYCFLYGPLSFLGLKVRGVAITTSLSNIFGLVSCCILFKKVIGGRISLKSIRPFPFDMLKKLIKLGIPTAGENISYQIAQIIITTFVNSMGSVPITAKIYCNTLCFFGIVYSNAIAGATSIVVGHAVGEEDYDFAFKRVLKSLASAMVISFLITLANYFLSPLTLRLFTDNIEIIEIGRRVMLVAIFLEFGRCVNLVVIRSERAAGDVLFPTVLGIASMWGISVVGAYILGISLKMGLVGVWIGMAADEIFRAVVVFVRWMMGWWRGRTLVDR